MHCRAPSSLLLLVTALPSAVLLLVIALLSAVLPPSAAAEPAPCAPLHMGHDSVVCVCNATYCDTVPPLADTGNVTVITSSRDGARFSVSTAQWSADSRADNRAKPSRVRFDSSAARQRVLGFGGAFTDAAGINIAKLPAEAQRRLIESYYGTGGIGYTIARVPMGGCDFSTRPYTYNDGDEDPGLTNFSLTREDTDYKLPYLRQALQLTGGEVRVFASPWSAPAWMKTNNALTGRGHLKTDHHQTWADYFVRFLDAYAAAGVSMWAVTAQNEPLDGLVPGFKFNCMGWTAGTQGAWVRDNLGPTLRKSRFNATKIMILDDQREMLPAWADAVLSDPATASFVDGVAVHWYGDWFFPAAALTATHDNHPDKFILNTEACEGSMTWQSEKVALGSWARAETYAADIIQDLNHWVAGWVDWNIALDVHGGPNWVSNFVDSPIIVDAERQQFYKQPMFYAMGHFAAFVPVGSVVVKIVERPEQVLVTAVVTPTNYTVTTLLNQAEHATEVTITDPAKGHLNLPLPAKSLTSVRWSNS